LMNPSRNLRSTPSPHRAVAPRIRQRGFSLLEILVAFVILALVATALSGLFSGALRNASASEDWSRATLVAESRLALAAAATPLKEASDRGTDDDGRIAWETKVAPYITPNTSPELATASENLPVRLFRVTVDVRFPGVDGSDRKLQLATVKIARRETLQ
jgi:general secretion pathway protein I